MCFLTLTAKTLSAAMSSAVTNIEIMYVNNTGSTDFATVVFTKNFNVNTPEVVYAAWEVIRVQTSSKFVYPISTSIGATYQLRDQHNTMGPFGAVLGSTWEINQDNKATTPVLQSGLCTA